MNASSIRRSGSHARFIVGSDRQVARLSALGYPVETRRVLGERLRKELAPDIELASPLASRLALARVMSEIAAEDVWLAPMAQRGGHAWLRVLDAIDEAIGWLCGMSSIDALHVVARTDDAVGARAAMLARAARAKDDMLARTGLVDARREGEVVARAIARADGARVVSIVGERRVRASGITHWSASDLVWWRALDASLSRVGGSALVELPTFDERLDATRTRGPLDTVMDAVAAALDAAPEAVPIRARLGDLRLAGELPNDVHEGLEVRQAQDATSQANAVADVVHAALASGASADAIVIAVPSFDEGTLAPIGRALRDAGVVAQAPDTVPGKAKGLVLFALDALGVARRGLVRAEVAALIRSAYVEAGRLSGISLPDEARRALDVLASKLVSTPTVRGVDPIASLEATVLASRRNGHGGEGERVTFLAALARRVGETLAAASAGETRVDHARAARRLWDALGLGVQFGSVAMQAMAEDSPAEGIARAELDALARDASGWVRLTRALDSYEETAARVGLRNAPAAFETFYHELTFALATTDVERCDRLASGGAIRIEALADLSSEPLALLVVVDANDGALAAGGTTPALIGTTLDARLREVQDPSLRPIAEAREAIEIASLAMGASEAARVVLAYRASDDDGRAMSPAPLVAWCEKGGATASAWRTKVVADRPLSRVDHELYALREAPGNAGRIAPAAARRATIERARESVFHEASEPARDAGNLSPVGAALARILLEETGGNPTAMAVTMLERFAACSFQGYAAQVLRAIEPSARADVADPREEGILLHGALAAAFVATARLWRERPRDRAAIRELGLAAADAFLARDAAFSGLRRVALDHARESTRLVIEWSLQDEAWDFAYAEQPFGAPGNAWGAVTLDDGETRVTLRGAIDRIDVAAATPGLRVIDYKRSEESASKQTRSLGETTFQVAVYARAAATALAMHDARGTYLPARRLVPGYAMKGHAEAWERAHAEARSIPYFEARAVAVMKAIRMGQLAPRPADPTVCERCAFDGACRKPRFAIGAAREDVTIPPHGG